MATQFLPYNLTNGGGKVGRQGILADIDGGNSRDVGQTSELRCDATSFKGLEGSAVVNHVGHTFQALLANEEVVDVIGDALEYMAHFVFFRHVGIHRLAQLQDLFNVGSACLTGDLSPLRQRLLGAFLLRCWVSKAFLNLLYKVVPGCQSVFVVLKPDQRREI